MRRPADEVDAETNVAVDGENSGPVDAEHNGDGDAESNVDGDAAEPGRFPRKSAWSLPESRNDVTDGILPFSVQAHFIVQMRTRG